MCITSYKLVLQDHQAFRRKSWRYLILDEAQNIKNFKSQRWQSLLNFNRSVELCVWYSHVHILGSKWVINVASLISKIKEYLNLTPLLLLEHLWVCRLVHICSLDTMHTHPVGPARNYQSLSHVQGLLLKAPICFSTYTLASHDMHEPSKSITASIQAWFPPKLGFGLYLIYFVPPLYIGGLQRWQKSTHSFDAQAQCDLFKVEIQFSNLTPVLGW